MRRGDRRLHDATPWMASVESTVVVQCLCGCPACDWHGAQINPSLCEPPLMSDPFGDWLIHNGLFIFFFVVVVPWIVWDEHTRRSRMSRPMAVRDVVPK